MVIVQIGTNDLDKEIVDVDRVLENYRQWAEFARDQFLVRTIVFCQVFVRTEGSFEPRKTTLEIFNERVFKLNARLQMLAGAHREAGLDTRYWKHPSLQQAPVEFIEDGVHLTPAGRVRYWYSMRNCIRKYITY